MTNEEIATLRAYLEQLVSDHRSGDAARPWFFHAAPREMVDDHLLIAGLSELCFKRKCRGPWVQQRDAVPWANTWEGRREQF